MEEMIKKAADAIRYLLPHNWSDHEVEDVARTAIEAAREVAVENQTAAWDRYWYSRDDSDVDRASFMAGYNAALPPVDSN